MTQSEELQQATKEALPVRAVHYVALSSRLDIQF